MDYTPLLPPLAHQSPGLDKSLDRGAFGLLMEFGTGKSWILVTTVGMKYAAGEIDTAIVVAPKGNYDDWGDKEDSHWRISMDPSVVAQTRFHLWRGGHSARERAALAELAGHRGLAILAINAEALSVGDRALKVVQGIMDARRATLMAVDESTIVKSMQARRTKNILELASGASMRRILTGFPAPRSSMDLYSQFRFLDWRILGHKSFFSYRNRYAILENKLVGTRHVPVIVGFRNTGELWGLIEPHSYRVRADDCLDLPERTYKARKVEMTDEQKKAYQEMKLFCTTQLAGESHVSATLAMTQLQKLHQIACGFVTDEQGITHRFKHRRIEELLEAIEEAGEEKVVIWSHWVPSIQEITAALHHQYGPGSVVQYFGGTSDADRTLAKQRFASDPNCHFFVGNPSVGGRGLNDLIGARWAIFYDNPWDLEQRLNAEARTRRKGSEIHKARGVVYTDLMVDGTVEVRLIKSLRKRIDIGGMITGDQWREWLL